MMSERLAVQVPRHGRAALVLVLGLIAGPGMAPTQGVAIAAPSLELSGWPEAGRGGEALFEPARRAVGDSAALRNAIRAAARRLEELGYLDARMDARWSRPGPDARLGVVIEAGPAWTYAKPVLAFSSAESAIVAPLLDGLSGAPADPARLSAQLERALSRLEQRGHAWALLTIGEWERDSGSVRVRITGSLGPVVTIGEVRIEGLRTTRPDLARRAVGRLIAMPYRPESARQAEERLRRLGVFEQVEWLGVEGGARWEQGVLRFRVSEPRYNRVEAAVGFQGEAGVVGLARFELANLLGTARAIGLDWQRRGRARSDLSARYREPLVLGWPVALEGTLAQQVQDTLFTRERFGIASRWSVGARDLVEAGYEEERVAQTRGAVRRAELSHSRFALERDTRDGVQDPRRGWSARVGASQTSRRERLTDGTWRRTRSASLESRAQWHLPLGARAGWALEVSGQGRFDGDRVASEYERLPLGGATSLRGSDEERFRVDRFARSRLELRWFTARRGERVHLFWDHAEMETREATVNGSRLRRERADGLGAGVRLPAAGGFVDLDYGMQPGAGFLDGRIHLALVTAF